MCADHLRQVPGETPFAEVRERSLEDGNTTNSDDRHSRPLAIGVTGPDENLVLAGSAIPIQ
jgi:hypothetical protein